MPLGLTAYEQTAAGMQAALPLLLPISFITLCPMLYGLYPHALNSRDMSLVLTLITENLRLCCSLHFYKLSAGHLRDSIRNAGH